MYTPTVVVVEDDSLTRKDLCSTFTSPPAEWQREFGVGCFSVVEAATASGLWEIIRSARREKRWIDVLWFDLGLPRDAQDNFGHNEPNVGLEVLNKIRDEDATCPEERVVGSIIVGSGSSKAPDVLQRLIRTQIVQNFVAKTWDIENREPFEALVDAYRIEQRRRWGEYKQTRLIHWATEAARVRVSRFSQIVANGVGKAVAEIRKLTEKIEEVYHLNASLDRENPICQLCRDAHISVTKIAEDCGHEQSSLDFFDEMPNESLPTTISSLLDSALDKVYPGLTSKVIKLSREDGPPVSVDIAPHYARMIFEEMLYGAIDATPPDGAIRISVRKDEWTVGISVHDQCVGFTEAQRIDIRQARVVQPEGGRVWGLALAHYVALNMGASLEVAASAASNIVTLHIPLAAGS